MNLWFDLKYALRLLNKSWGHSLLCVGVVALSVGLATFVYSLAYGLWLMPLQIPDSQRWYVVHAATNTKAVPQVHSLDAYTYQELLKSNRTVKHLGAVSMRPGVLSEGQESINLRSFAISPSLLTATKVGPRLGRMFADSEAQPGGPLVVILGFETWQNYFASDPAIVGKPARINGKPMQIIGVMPKGFSLGMDADLWLPLEKINLTPSDAAAPVEPFIALEKTQTSEAVLQELKKSIDLINLTYPERYNPGRHLALAPAHSAYTDTAKSIPAMLGVLAVAVALLGSMNMAMLFFARLMERGRELALRNALGASHWRLLRQCLLESSVIVLLGLLSGVALAAVGTYWERIAFDGGIKVLAYAPAAEFAIRTPHLLVAIGSAIAIWLLSTLIPAWRIVKQDAAIVLAGSGKGTSNGGSSKSANFLVALQIMISCLVLVASSNATLVLYNMANQPKGFSTANITVSFVPTAFSTAYASTEKRLQYFDALTANIQANAPGAEVGFANAVPTFDNFAVPMAIEGTDAVAVRDVPKLRLTSVSENYFQLFGISLRRGRLFDRTDSSSSIDVAILDENLARRYWPNQDPLGKRIQMNPADNGPWLTIVGLVSHVGLASDRGSFDGKVYRPLRQSASSEFVVIARLPPKSPLGEDARRTALTSAAFAVDRDLPLNGVQSLDRFYEARESVGGPDRIFIVIAAITAFLAATGLFGLISRSVALRTQEVGIRRALGATQWQVTILFLRQGAVHLTIGILLGGGIGIVATSALAAIWPDILKHVVLVSLSVLLGFTVVTFSASFSPTRRAVGLEPGDALRYG